MKKKIGIIGGMAPASTSDYYLHMIDEYHKHNADSAYPEIHIHSLNFQDVIDQEYMSFELMEDSLRHLKECGCEIVVAACNSIHVVYDEVSPRVDGVDWIDVVTPMAKSAQSVDAKRIGLVGTLFTNRSTFFTDAFLRAGIEIVKIPEGMQEELHEHIYNDIVHKRISKRAIDLSEEIQDYFEDQSSQGIAVACTELPYLFEGRTRESLPQFSSMELHARYAMQLALGLRD